MTAKTFSGELTPYVTNTQCKCLHIFIAQFAIFHVFQEVNGS